MQSCLLDFELSDQGTFRLSGLGEGTGQAVPLPAARRGAEYAGHLFGTTAILGEDATRDRVIGQLSNPLLSLFIFMGHGDLHELLLAGEDRFGLKDLASINWQNAPFIHLDCCHTGIVQGALGGRFIGMPSAMIRCGAGAVLASYYPLYDQPAMIFSRALYDLMMKEKRMVGEALLQARCKMHELSGGVPLYWATSILWGNPYIRL
jgi:CHAT domain-containing protein